MLLLQFFYSVGSVITIMMSVYETRTLLLWKITIEVLKERGKKGNWLGCGSGSGSAAGIRGLWETAVLQKYTLLATSSQLTSCLPPSWCPELSDLEIRQRQNRKQNVKMRLVASEIQGHTKASQERALQWVLFSQKVPLLPTLDLSLSSLPRKETLICTHLPHFPSSAVKKPMLWIQLIGDRINVFYCPLRFIHSFTRDSL